MNPVTYDLDTSGGLMEQIQELIAPPESEHPPPRKRRRHEYFKRPGRAVNRDSCDSCREGGDLICCDRCPASFHLTCCDPPLEEEDLPDGEWLCHQCTINPKDNDDTASISSRGSQDETRKSSRRKRGGDDRFEISKPFKAPILRLNDRLMKEGKQCLRLVQLQAYKEAQKELEGPSTSTTVPSPQMPELQPMDVAPPPPLPAPAPVVPPKEDPTPKPKEEEAPINPFEMLIKAAKMENPKQFDIPESLMVFAPLPETTTDDDVVAGGNPFKKLTDDAKMLNPKQFEIPESLMVFAPLPGTTRKKRKEELSKNYRKPHELDNGLIPLPAKLCFMCSKSCRVAPLIQCDYCPLLFHKDCVDPPLTSMPTGRWMCPNHPERSLAKFEAGLHTEKCQLFNDFHGRLDQDTIKINFFKKLRSTGPPRKDYVPPVRRKAMVVPNAIKCQYLLPPPRLPHPHEKPCMLNALPQGLKSVGPGCTQEEQEEWLKSVVALQTSISRYLSQKALSKDPNIKQKIITSSTLVKKESGAYVSSTTSSAAATPTPSTVTSPNHRTVSPATSLSASLSANAKLPSSAEVAAQNAKARDEADAEDKDRRFESRVANGPVTAINGPYRTSSPKPGSLPKSDAVVRSTIVVKDGHMVNNSGPKLKLGDCTPSGMNAEVKVGFVQHAESTNGPTTLNGGIAAKYPHNAIQKGNTTVIHKVVTNTSSTTFNAAGTPPRTAGNSVSAHPTMKIVSPHAVGGVKTTIGRVSSGTMLSGSMQAHGSGKVVTIPPSSVGSGKPNQTGTVAAAVPAKISPASLSSSPAIINLNSSLQACIEGTNEVELTKLDDRLVQILAWQRLQQLLPQKPQPPPPVNRKPSLQPSSVSPTPPAAPSIQETIVQARAMFCPLTAKGQGQSVPMCYRTLQIGTGYDNDVCLTNYGHCNYVSSKHACIFFDENSKHYELLNYSEHGTTVDNVLYSCDFSEKNVAPPPASSFVKSVRKLAKKKKRDGGDLTVKDEKADVKVDTGESQDLCTMSAWPSQSRTQCNCKGSSSCLIGGTGAGWEGTALLHHGSYIKMGCLQFVFSITEFVSKPKTEKVVPSVLRTQLARCDSPPV